MFHITRAFRWRRLAAILAVGAVAMGFAQRHVASLRPRLAPDAIARQGRTTLEATLATVAASAFGQTRRGEALVDEAQRYLDGGRILFADGLGKVSLFRKEFGRRPVVYINVPRLSNRYTLPDVATLARAVTHEMLHAVQNTGCYEEECDAFIAAAQADAAVRGVAVEFPVLRDAAPIAAWVREVYEGKTPSPDYAPLGQNREWLTRASGAESAGSRSTGGPDRRPRRR